MAHARGLRWQYWIYSSWFKMVVLYRQTALGPLWLLVKPAIFVAMLGVLYATITNTDLNVFIPHLSIGYVVWQLIVAFVSGSTEVGIRGKADLLQSGLEINDLVIVHMVGSIIRFFHHIIVILFVYILYPWKLDLYSLTSIFGLLLLVINGYWIGLTCSIVGARFRDVSEVIGTVMGAMFFVTPIIWMATASLKGSLIGPYLVYNPFYHFLELVRAPVLGTPIDQTSWLVVGAITVGGLILGWVLHRLYAERLPLWV